MHIDTLTIKRLLPGGTCVGYKTGGASIIRDTVVMSDESTKVIYRIFPIDGTIPLEYTETCPSIDIQPF